LQKVFIRMEVIGELMAPRALNFRQHPLGARRAGTRDLHRSHAAL
jgi:hypothetical protein